MKNLFLLGFVFVAVLLFASGLFASSKVSAKGKPEVQTNSPIEDAQKPSLFDEEEQFTDIRSGESDLIAKKLKKIKSERALEAKKNRTEKKADAVKGK